MKSFMKICVGLLFMCFSDICTADPASDQILEYSKLHNESRIARTTFGAPIPDLINSITVGQKGPLLLQDTVLLETYSHFSRERIPERVLHAKGSGAFGFFNVTNDITKYCKAKVFEEIGKITKIAVRFSFGILEKGTAETSRGNRGFAIKFYTEDGIWDLVGNHVPIFFTNDVLLAVPMSRAILRNPVTNLKDSNMFWDAFTANHESALNVMYAFSYYGLPLSYRDMAASGINIFKMVNKEYEGVYVKFHYSPELGLKFMSGEEAAKLKDTDPDHFTRDLYNAIARKEYPAWILYIQVMTFEKAEQHPWNPFDNTKFWPENEFPLIEVGKFILDQNPTNFFADVEQSAYSPANLVPGIEPSPDTILQGRMFLYKDSQIYRLGINHIQLPVNRPKFDVLTYNRDGFSTFIDQNGAPNYYPNSFNGPEPDSTAHISGGVRACGDIQRYNFSSIDHYTQPNEFWMKMTENQKKDLVNTIAHLAFPAASFIQDRVVEMFTKVNSKFGKMLVNRLNFLKKNQV